MTKIINLGLPRTGTQTLHKMLQILGYSSRHYSSRVWDSSDFRSVCEVSIAIPFTALADAYPDARYLITVRDQDAWVESVIRTMPKASPRWNPFWSLSVDQLRSVYDERLRYSRKFAGADLLEYDVCGSQDWGPLCRWLDLDIPDTPVPHRDRTK